MTITLNEEKARLWLAQQADAVTAGEDYDIDIAEAWEPRDAGEESTAVDLVWEAQQEDAAVFDGLDGRVIELIYDADSDGGSYFYVVRFPNRGAARYLHVASPLREEWRKIGDRGAVGIEAAIAILEEAAQDANFIAGELAAYVTAQKES